MFPEDTFHGGLEIVGDKTIDNGVHAAVKAAQGYRDMIDNEDDISGHGAAGAEGHLANMDGGEANCEDDQHGDE